eukprot:454311-Rhodomonas_salina.2
MTLTELCRKCDDRMYARLKILASYEPVPLHRLSPGPNSLRFRVDAGCKLEARATTVDELVQEVRFAGVECANDSHYVHWFLDAFKPFDAGRYGTKAVVAARRFHQLDWVRFVSLAVHSKAQEIAKQKPSVGPEARGSHELVWLQKSRDEHAS